MKGSKVFAVIIILFMMTFSGCGNFTKTTVPTKEAQVTGNVYVSTYEGMTAAEITATLTLEEKANQMMIPAIYNVKDNQMKSKNYGSILSTMGLVTQTAEDWTKIINTYQNAALQAASPIPFIYGQDSVHGVNYCVNTVIFPHNINIGAANDPELTYQMGLAVADEMIMTKMIWNYAPCVAVAVDPRWGRTYESYSSVPELVKMLSSEFTKGLIDGGVVACAKHYLGDGNARFGTGEVSDVSRLIDRGNAIMTETEIDDQLAIYQKLIEDGVQTIMISHSALNGVKMHENAQFMNEVLREQLGFTGVVVSDWNSIHNIEGADELKEQVIIAVNAGIDWLMEPDRFQDCAKYIVEAVNEGSITEERVNQAVTRIIQLKLDAGLFEDPYLEKKTTKHSATGSKEYRELAQQLVEKSLVLIKNDGEELPLKTGMKVFITGPAADDSGVQCGGWTRQWNGSTDINFGNKKFIEGSTTILEAFTDIAKEYDLTIITEKEMAEKADVILLCVGEQPYAEWNGDTADLELTGKLGLPGNLEAIKFAKSLGKPTITLIIAGRNVIIDEYMDDWDSIVMCGLFGSEGDGVANVLVGKSDFRGKLAMPWYADTDDISTKKTWLDVEYGLTYKNVGRWNL